MDGKAEGLTASVLFGTAISACGVAITAPLVTIGGLALGAAGSYILIKEIIEEPQRRKFEACELVKNNQLPKLVKEGKGDIYHFSLLIVTWVYSALLDRGRALM